MWNAINGTVCVYINDTLFMKISDYAGSHLYWDHLCPCARIPLWEVRFSQ